MTEIVEVRVTEIKQAGISVEILGSNQRGFIRYQEMSWDRSVNSIPYKPQVGEEFKAKILPNQGKENFVLLSVRQLINPWENIQHKYYHGQSIRGEVVNVRSSEVFVQIEPGIDAIIHPSDLPISHRQPLNEVLFVGDQVQGIIIHLNYNKKQMTLSVNRQILHLPAEPIERARFQQHLFKEKFKPPEDLLTVQTWLSEPTNKPYHHRFPPSTLKKILIIDDNPADIQQISHILQRDLEVETISASNHQQALEHLTPIDDYDLVIVDRVLGPEDGEKIAAELLLKRPNIPLLFTSNNPIPTKHIALGGREFLFCPKNPKEILSCVLKLLSSDSENTLETNQIIHTVKGRFIHQLGMIAFARRTLQDILSELLRQLIEKTQVSYAMVLEVDSDSKTVSIKAVVPELEANVFRYVTDSLYYSPVRNVVEERRVFYRSDIGQDRGTDLKNFFPLLEFTSFLGIPLTISDFITPHTLFVLDKNKSSLSAEVQELVYMTAQIIQVALERATFLDYMRRYEQRYSLGQLLGSLVHELSNKLDGLKGFTESLPVNLNRIAEAVDTDERSRRIGETEKLITKVARVGDELRELVTAYSRLASNSFEVVNVNDVLQKIRLQMAMYAREMGVQILLQVSPQIPSVKAIKSQLEQVIINLTLNAVQQINKQNQQMTTLAHEQRQREPLLQQGVVVLQSRHTEAGFVEIQIIDTGPGIHYPHQEGIFFMDTPRRQGGHGLGLFVSRNFIEIMGGYLYLVDSILFLGTVFVVGLPVFRGEE